VNAIRLLYPHSVSTLFLVEEMQAIHSDYSMCDSYICYGCVVRLVCTDSGVALPPMVCKYKSFFFPLHFQVIFFM